MTHTVNEIYNQIGNEIINAIGDDEWTEAIIEFSYYGNAASYNGRYWRKNGTKQDFDVSFDVFEAFEELNGIMSESENNKWNYAVFKLSQSGEFSIDFDWYESIADLSE